MKILDEVKLDYDDVLIVPRPSNLSSRKEVNLNVEYSFKYSKNILRGVPIIAANMEGVGTVSMARALFKFTVWTALTKDYQYNSLLASKLGIVWTTSPSLYNRNDFSHHPFILCLDVANGYTLDFDTFVEQVRLDFPYTIIIAGNVATREGTRNLILAGADIVKVGIGSGSVCTTRLKTGVGYPQLSAVMECAEVAHELGAHVIADGGCKNPGDVAKAFAAGADFVMLGGMLAGHDESEQLEEYEPYTGAGIEFHGSAYHNNEDYKTAEGKSVRIPCKGKVENTIKDILGGLRSCCTYVGAHSLEELKEKAYFVKVNRTHNRIFE